MVVGINPFLFKGDFDQSEYLYTIQVAKIVSVDEDNALVQIEYVDKSKSGRDSVPFPMPFVGNGWGMLAMPSIGTMVLVGNRPMQFPVILAWSPLNTSSPDSFYGRMLSDFNAKKIEGGELYYRNRMEYANCRVCHNVNSLADWRKGAVKIGNKSVDKCPTCLALAEEKTSPPIINKLYLGCFIYQHKDGTIEISQEVDIDNGFNTDLNEKVGSFKIYPNGSFILKDKLDNRIETSIVNGGIKVQQGVRTQARSNGAPYVDNEIIVDGSSVELKDDGQVVIQQKIKNGALMDNGASIIMSTTGGITLQTKDNKVSITIGANGEVNLTANTKVTMVCPEINLGDSNAKVLALAQKTADKVNGFISTFNSHMHLASGPGAPTTSPKEMGFIAPSILATDIATTKARGT